MIAQYKLRAEIVPYSRLITVVAGLVLWIYSVAMLIGP